MGIRTSYSLSKAVLKDGVSTHDFDEKGDYQGAIAAYSQAIVLNPNYVEAYNRRGIARRALGDNKGALADFNEAPAN
jgi:tetratricopeptide (TPR) repeat protein